ncbi:hypothetical protein GDO86_013445 [Hymenochirus boettgeri]|uniref:Leucine-rich repeat-containing protein 27 n=1 Tax=Hymenochirus boettgeri TaxID=247094 RepID=A0A8T2IU76_9PIPI|nr:hypothetical protein GDO86_013445 [Hymenochirus boettgeri]
MFCKQTSNNICEDPGGQTSAEMNPAGQRSNTLTSLDLSKKNLDFLSEELYINNPAIQNLHLGWNALSFIPESLFIQLPHLSWLDVRYNQITSLPASIGEHRKLKYLLLEGNPIKTLPVEFGDMSTLKALNLRHCPLQFPPEDVVHKGLESILTFLRHARRGLLTSDTDDIVMPTVEKLRLKDLERPSLESSEDWGNNDERLHFELLKNRIMEEEIKEMAEVQALGLPSITQEGSPLIAKGKWNFLTDARHLLDGRTRAVQRHAEEKERLAAINKKMNDQEILKNWQKQSKKMQIQKEKIRKLPDNQVQTMLAPYATDLDAGQMGNWDKQRPLVDEKQERMPRIMAGNSEDRDSKDRRLNDRIKHHIQAMNERRKNPKATALQEIEAARKDLEEASKLQAELIARKQEQELEYRFSAFTGEMSPVPFTPGKPQNIFAVPL